MKNAYYFSHDTNARNDPKIMAMRQCYKDGYGWYWIIVEMLAEQDGYRLEIAEWTFDAIAMALLCEAIAAQKFVTDCIERFKLFSSDGGYFWSESLIRRMQKKEENSQKRAEAGRKGAEKRWNNGNQIAMPKQPDGNAMAKHSKVKESKVKESKVNKIYIAPTLEEVQAYCDERQNGVDAKRFFDSYSVADWHDRDGKPVRNWKQKMINVWEPKAEKPAEKPRSYTKEV